MGDGLGGSSPGSGAYDKILAAQLRCYTAIKAIASMEPFFQRGAKRHLEVLVDRVAQ